MGSTVKTVYCTVVKERAESTTVRVRVGKSKRYDTVQYVTSDAVPLPFPSLLTVTDCETCRDM